MRYEFTLTGETPLLMHADDVELADTLEAYRKAPENKNSSKAGDDRSPPWTYKTYLYRDESNIAMPSACLMAAIRGAAVDFSLPGSKRGKTLKELSQTAIIPKGEYFAFFTGPNRDRAVSRQDIASIDDSAPFSEHVAAIRQLGFDLFVKRAKIGSSKHVRVRPRFEHWMVQGLLDVSSADIITGTILQQILDRAGTLGLCDWRAGCRTPGPFGRFLAAIKKVK